MHISFLNVAAPPAWVTEARMASASAPLLVAAAVRLIDARAYACERCRQYKRVRSGVGALASALLLAAAVVMIGPVHMGGTCSTGGAQRRLSAASMPLLTADAVRLINARACAHGRYRQYTRVS